MWTAPYLSLPIFLLNTIPPAIWFAMPITELLTMLYAAAAIRTYTKALPSAAKE